MKRLTLLRHAHAVDIAASGRDFDRPLSPRGIEEASVAAARLVSELGSADRLRASPALRTRQTADALLRAGFVNGGAVEYPEDLYCAEIGTLLELAQSTPDDVGHLVLVAHNPGLSDLASRLSRRRDFAGLGTAQWVSVELDLDRWAALPRAS